MSTIDYRSPAQRFAGDLLSLIADHYGTGGQVGRSTNVQRPDAFDIVTVVGGVQFTISVREGRRR